MNDSKLIAARLQAWGRNPEVLTWRGVRLSVPAPSAVAPAALCSWVPPMGLKRGCEAIAIAEWVLTSLRGLFRTMFSLELNT
jgi:hypothetical protein